LSADVPDADVFVKLVDVYPDGTAYNLAQTALRLRFCPAASHRNGTPVTGGPSVARSGNSVARVALAWCHIAGGCRQRGEDEVP
jgi:hypothetical protein